MKKASAGQRCCTLRLDDPRPTRRDRWRLRRLFRVFHERFREDALDPEYQAAYQDGLRSEGCDDGLEFWDKPHLAPVAPVLIAADVDVGDELLEGEVDLLLHFRERLVKGLKVK